MTNWTQYHRDPSDPADYENQVRQTGRFTATVWALHLNVPSFLVPFTLTLMGGRSDLTYEYSSGGSWADWGQPARDRYDNHLVIYFRASVARAGGIGARLAGAVYGFSDGDYAISTAGDFKALITDTRVKREEDDGAETPEAEGEPGQ